MNLHHTKHHQAYVNGLNAAEDAYAKTETPKERIKLQAALKFNGGGMSLFFCYIGFLSLLSRLHAFVAFGGARALG